MREHSNISAEFLALGIKLRNDWYDKCVEHLLSTHPSFGTSSLQDQVEQCYVQFLTCDMNTAGAGSLPNLQALHNTELPGRFVLQVDEMVNVGADAKERYKNTNSNTRCLKLSLTDGVARVQALEYRYITALHIHSPAGLKIAITDATVRRGMLLLQPDNVQILGGEVERLEKARSRFVEYWNLPPEQARSRAMLGRDGQPLPKPAAAAQVAWEVPLQRTAANPGTTQQPEAANGTLREEPVLAVGGMGEGDAGLAPGERWPQEESRPGSAFSEAVGGGVPSMAPAGQFPGRGQWKCQRCGEENVHPASHCEVCNAPRAPPSRRAEAMPAGIAQVGDPGRSDWERPGELSNSSGSANAHAAGAPGGPPAGFMGIRVGLVGTAEEQQHWEGGRAQMKAWGGPAAELGTEAAALGRGQSSDEGVRADLRRSLGRSSSTGKGGQSSDEGVGADLQRSGSFGRSSAVPHSDSSGLQAHARPGGGSGVAMGGEVGEDTSTSARPFQSASAVLRGAADAAGDQGQPSGGNFLSPLRGLLDRPTPRSRLKRLRRVEAPGDGRSKALHTPREPGGEERPEVVSVEQSSLLGGPHGNVANTERNPLLDERNPFLDDLQQQHGAGAAQVAARDAFGSRSALVAGVSLGGALSRRRGAVAAAGLGQQSAARAPSPSAAAREIEADVDLTMDDGEERAATGEAENELPLQHLCQLHNRICSLPTTAFPYHTRVLGAVTKAVTLRHTNEVTKEPLPAFDFTILIEDATVSLTLAVSSSLVESLLGGDPTHITRGLAAKDRAVITKVVEVQAFFANFVGIMKVEVPTAEAVPVITSMDQVSASDARAEGWRMLRRLQRSTQHAIA
ncbi:recQ-mediated genome instability protein 1, variant 2 [Cymbomonas tetramitiformis]|uniref:RecQ-mediated genome instability protein 1 n=1 Tax=Cymbomonas tetramitiformis TaxID=36881 RepID=A0AAE0BIW4_9CHLO|nr:recQ-mediated genome instability protein 1, variant 2 [Cymbomonas tetramitiformis]